MGLLGKYTTYVGGAQTAAHTLLSKLFPAGPFATMVANADEVKARAYIEAESTMKLSNGVSGLQPSDGIQAGDLGMFPNGVDLSFAMRAPSSPASTPPDVSTVKWTKPGDPANPYIPDITSPGPGLTDGTDKNVDPQITVEQARSIATTEDAGDQNLRNPIVTGPEIYNANQAGQSQSIGDSGANS
jgi:hypothetical protein